MIQTSRLLGSDRNQLHNLPPRTITIREPSCSNPATRRPFCSVIRSRNPNPPSQISVPPQLSASSPTVVLLPLGEPPDPGYLAAPSPTHPSPDNDHNHHQITTTPSRPWKGPIPIPTFGMGNAMPASSNYLHSSWPVPSSRRADTPTAQIAVIPWRQVSSTLRVGSRPSAAANSFPPMPFQST